MKSIGFAIGVLIKFLDDLFILAGCGLIVIGTYQICPVATWFVGGVTLVLFGVLVGLGKRGAN